MHHLLICIGIYILNLIDLITTRKLITLDSSGESNPIMSSLYSLNLDILIKVFVVGIILASLYYLSKKELYYTSSMKGLYFLLIIYSIMAINNVLVLFFWVF